MSAHSQKVINNATSFIRIETFRQIAFLDAQNSVLRNMSKKNQKSGFFNRCPKNINVLTIPRKTSSK